MFGNIVLYGWPVVVKVLFDNKALPVAILVSIIAGYLFLPEQIVFDLPLFPDLNKHTIPVVAVLFCVFLLGEKGRIQGLDGWVPKGGFARLFILVLMIGAFLTVITNSDPQVFGPLFLPGLSLLDAVSRVSQTLMTILPLLLARKFLAYPHQHRVFLFLLSITAGIYSFLALYEIRMSPQLSNMVYGFFPHSWLQHVRSNGFRPVVFLNHGLWLSIFFAYSLIAAVGCARLAEKKNRTKFLALSLWILMTLVLSKSLGALTIAVILLPLAFFFKPRLQLLVCACFAVVVLLYPALRGADLVPVDKAVEWAEGINEERAASLQFRLHNEDAILERAQLRPTFGWGGWGRGAVFDEDGNETSVPDGYWVIIVSVGGWVRYLGEFGLLCVPLILAAVSYRKSQFGLETSVLAIALTVSILDLVPNATISPITWMLAGALWGRLELGRIAQSEGQTVVKDRQSTRSTPYTRFAKGHVPDARAPTGSTTHRQKVASPRDSKPAPRYSRFTQEK
jgi:hypothetical protein